MRKIGKTRGTRDSRMMYMLLSRCHELDWNVTCMFLTDPNTTNFVVRSMCQALHTSRVASREGFIICACIPCSGDDEISL